MAPQLESGEPSPAALAIETIENFRKQFDELSKFVMEEIEGEPSRPEGVVSCVIRLLKEKTPDMLERMWQAQTALNVTTFESNPDEITGCVSPAGENIDFGALLAAGNYLKGIVTGNQPEDAGHDPRRDNVNKWVQQYTLAMRQECAELMDSTNWKWWRSKVDKFDLQNIWVELVDILHFWMSACMVAGLTPRDVFKMYREKNKVNFERQESGYLVKDENDSRHLAPET